MGRFREEKIIKNEDEANKSSSLYILPVNDNEFKLIVTDDNGNNKISTSVNGTSEFIELEDAPISYTNNSGKVVTVNETEDGLIFTDIPDIQEAKYNDITESPALDVYKRINKSEGVDANYRKSVLAFNYRSDGGSAIPIDDDLVAAFPTIFQKKDNQYIKLQNDTFFNVKMFGAKGDNVTDDSAAFQRAVDFCELFSVKTLMIPYGAYLLNTPVVFNRGGVKIQGQGSLNREESWIGYSEIDYPENFPLGISNSYLGCCVIIPKNSTGFVFSESVLDNVYFESLGFNAVQRTVGNTNAIDFHGTFSGPTWNFIVKHCHFNSFNKCVNFQSTTQYCVAFIDMSYNAFKQCDEVLYMADIADSLIVGMGIRNLSWGLTFEHNRCHDNARLIRGCFAKDLVSIKQNNLEGSIAYSDGTTPKYSIDLELINCQVDFIGNHAEGIHHNILFATTAMRDKNGNRLPDVNNNGKGNGRATVKLSGNNFDGTYGSSVLDAVTLEGVNVIDEDNFGAKLHGCTIQNTLSGVDLYKSTEEGKKETALYVFPVNDLEHAINRDNNSLAYQTSYTGIAASKYSFLNNSRQVTRFKSNTASIAATAVFGGNQLFKYYGMSVLINVNGNIGFFSTFQFRVVYNLNGQSVEQTIGTDISSVTTVRRGWNILTAIFPKGKLPDGAIINNLYIDLPTGELDGQSVIIDNNITQFAISDDLYKIRPYFDYKKTPIVKQGTFEKSEIFYDSDDVMNVCTKQGTIAPILSGVTASGSVGDRFFICNDPSQLFTGGYINIIGYFYKISNIEGNKVYLSGQYNDQGNNASVSWDAPIFKTISLI